MTYEYSIPPRLMHQLQPPTTRFRSAKSRSLSASRSRQTAAGRKRRGTPFRLTPTAGLRWRSISAA